MKYLIVLLLLATPAFPQVTNAPKLKDSVALDIRTLQVEIESNTLQLLQIQSKQAMLTAQLQTKLKTALKDSDLDDTQFDLNSNTLVVTPKANLKE